MPDLSKFSFCIPRYAGPFAPMCLRPVHMRGVFNTASLCGRIRPSDMGGDGGSDQAIVITEALVDDERFVCRECAYRLREK